ncbi:Uncharacterised protein [Vibrio cholerae]|nr:Uncharacterised protein [Vibrio cholerae]
MPSSNAEASPNTAAIRPLARSKYASSNEP